MMMKYQGCAVHHYHAMQSTLPPPLKMECEQQLTKNSKPEEKPYFIVKLVGPNSKFGRIFL